ncbi:protein-disulfide reductase DsbD family protein [Variovorax dokdonensis]|uniref:Protein-disulfide reductase DsbD family protein n=1 Tax=Variovorax dokdonensis TaxID=344883 RepID=A0ABT7NGI6_9BURK|nr:thioredoxin family protein [Variovorax dokdonensis]MDM0047070.1 protein-disulfide reductase DsbD family protein [Variovorax dokdonensis]
MAGAAFAQPLATGPAQTSVTTPRVRAELMAFAPQGVAAGQPVWVGLQIQHQPQWHTYWKNAGDSGLPTELRWTLPQGVQAGDIDWPAPHKIPVGSLANYGYEGTVLLPVPLTVSPDFRPSPLARSLTVKLQASWLVCKLECIPEEGSFALDIPLQGSTALQREAFEAAFAARPAPLEGNGAVTVEGDRLNVRLQGLPESVRGRALDFFPETGEIIRNAAVSGRDWTQSWTDATWSASLPLDPQRAASPANLPLVVALAEPRTGETPRAWRVDAPVSGQWPAPATRAEVSPQLQTALNENAANASSAGAATTTSTLAGGSFLFALIGALAGGLLLNLMPCVFPILAIKVLGFTRHSDDVAAHRRSALLYATGVLLSLLALGGAMLALRATGAQLGWGFQLQSPAVVAGLAALFTLIGLNLAGMFDIHAPGALLNLQARTPWANDLLSGVLAVVVATPCTAPFMGASLGLAVTLPAAQALLLFAALGVGLALPYVLAAYIPGMARALPRPGAWMQTLQRLLAFPMFGTVAWLVWVLGQQTGIDGAGALLALLVGLAAIVWALTLRGRTRVVLAGVFVLATAGLASALGGSILSEKAPESVAASGDRWQPWSEARVAQLVAQGRPVFVDFTAAWCITCQYNKKTTLSDAEILAMFDAKKVVTLRADWTRRDPAITAALSALGRSGVPVYALHAPGTSPVVMNEILSKSELTAALGRL